MKFNFSLLLSFSWRRGQSQRGVCLSLFPAAQPVPVLQAGEQRGPADGQPAQHRVLPRVRPGQLHLPLRQEAGRCLDLQRRGHRGQKVGSGGLGECDHV